MESNIVINLNENGISTVCCTVNGEKIELNLTEAEEVEILRKITRRISTCRNCQSVKNNISKSP